MTLRALKYPENTIPLYEYIISFTALKYPENYDILIWIYRVFQSTEKSRKIQYPYMDILSAVGQWNIRKNTISLCEGLCGSRARGSRASGSKACGSKACGSRAGDSKACGSKACGSSSLSDMQMSVPDQLFRSSRHFPDHPDNLHIIWIFGIASGHFPNYLTSFFWLCWKGSETSGGRYPDFLIEWIKPY